MFQFIILLLIAKTYALYTSDSNVFHLSTRNFDKYVVDSDEIWIIEFYAPWCGACQAFAPEYQKTAAALHGVIKVGAVNVDEHKEFARRFDITSLPTVKIFGGNKTQPDDYLGHRGSDGLVDAALKAIQKKITAQLGKQVSTTFKKSADTDDVIELTDSNFDITVLACDDMWLVEFYVPWCKYCQQFAPRWADVARKLQGKVKVGAINAGVNRKTSARYKVSAYPTIKYFPFGFKSEEPTEVPIDPTTNLVEWALDKLLESAPPPEVKQLTDYYLFKKVCEEKQLCVISILPHILDCQQKCRTNYLNIIKSVSENFKKMDWGWVWAEASAQPDLEDALEVGGSGYPLMVVVNISKMKYSVLRGAFCKNGVDEFLRELSYGRGSSEPIKRVANIMETKAWDNKDAEEIKEAEKVDAESMDDKDEVSESNDDSMKDEL